MSFLEKIERKAIAGRHRLVLAEGIEPRTMRAAKIIAEKRIASEVFLVGCENQIKQTARDEGVSLAEVTLVDPEKAQAREEFTDVYYELRKHKKIDRKTARSAVCDPLNWAALMVKTGRADAMVAGAKSPTAKVLVSGFSILKMAKGVRHGSSCFVMDTKNSSWGEEGRFIFSDCAIIPDPTEEQLADIAIQAAHSCRTFLGVEPLVAMLSFSTKGSARHSLVDKVSRALARAKKAEPSLVIDGEMQLDAAIVAEVGKQKSPGSPVAGRANTLIFPDLQSGNIGYKLVQRLAGAEAYGPILQGFAKPISDLSRGCSVEDIVHTSAITLTQVKENGEDNP